jgi:hypothetical protein
MVLMMWELTRLALRFLRTREDGPSVGKNTANPKFGVTSFKQLSKV